ncbi:hypothetical protein [Moraxella lacunata]
MFAFIRVLCLKRNDIYLFVNLKSLGFLQNLELKKTVRGELVEP